MQGEDDSEVALADGRAVWLRGRRGTARAGHVVYVHGATFPSELSVFFRFDGRSWADALAETGCSVWGFDFVGYGRSSRYPAHSIEPCGRSTEALPQLLAVLQRIRSLNGRRPVTLLAHSWGATVAARAASDRPEWIDRLALFGPIVRREMPIPSPPLPALRPVNVWEQYRRFIEDVPRGHSSVLLDRHIESWSRRYLASDPTSATRNPPSVLTPTGPMADIQALWHGAALYDAGRITQPLLVVRGEWDSLCTDADAVRLLREAASRVKRDAKIRAGTHLLHLEESRVELYRTVNEFLREPMD